MLCCLKQLCCYEEYLMCKDCQSRQAANAGIVVSDLHVDSVVLYLED